MLLLTVYLILSIVILYFGAEFALDAAEKVGRFFGLSPLVIGLLIVGFGTSLPELFVSQLGSFRGQYGLAIGNIIGSNVANIFLILSVGGLLSSLPMGRGEIFSQLVFHLSLTVVLAVVLFFRVINLWTLLVFFIFFGIYLTNTFYQMKKQREHLRNVEELDELEEIVEEIGFLTFIKLIVGFGLLYAGGELLVYSGSNLGLMLGISTYVISAVFVAFGTSFPELVTTLLACLKKKNTDLITGNVLGSNVFNVAFILGGLGIYNFKLESSFVVEISLLLGVSLLMLILAKMHARIAKFWGFLFLSIYLGTVFYWFNAA